MKKTIFILALLGCFNSTTYADPISSIVIPKLAEATIEELAKIIDTIITVTTPENKEWAKYVASRRLAIIKEYQSSRKSSLAQFRNCAGEDPTYEQSSACSETHANNMKKIKMRQKEELKELIEESKTHTERLNKKREILQPLETISEE